jgi:hypothetical protein
MTPSVHTEADFDSLSWHDCNLWRLDFVVGDPDVGDGTTDLALGIDFIVEWLRATDRSTRFRIAPATLVFHGVTDPRIAIAWGSSDHRVAIHQVSISRIVRERVQDQKVFLDRPYYSWRIETNWPAGGEITFGAVGFTQTLLAEPILCDKQRLSREERDRLTGR